MDGHSRDGGLALRSMKLRAAGIVAALSVACAFVLVTAAPAGAQDRDCAHFSSQAAAQDFYESAGPGDPHRLDADGDGIACESNPCPCRGTGGGEPSPPPPPPPPESSHPLGASVTRVIDGDTLDARLADGREITVRLIGIDTPETRQSGTPVECGGEQATEALTQLVEGQQVNLVSDPTRDAVDAFGRSLFYVDRLDGLDAGEEMVRRGWAEVFVFEPAFQRFRRYRAAQAGARRAREGAWGSCDGDFHLTRQEEARERRRSAVRFMRRYYSLISRERFATAWDLLGRRARRQIGPFRQWRAGHRRSLGVSVLAARARLSRGRAVVSVSLLARDRDACSGRVVRQRFRGSWILAPRRDSWIGVRARIRKTSGGRVRLSETECRPKPPRSRPRRPPTDCQGYSPCLPPGPDVDCAGGSGDGPRYVNGPMSVRGSDPYGLDSDGNGVGCES
jgi:endonuclease YncB( thermonuclease family)